MTEKKERLVNMYSRLENALEELSMKRFCQGTECTKCEMFDGACKLDYVKKQLFDLKCGVELRYNVRYEEKIIRKKE